MRLFNIVLLGTTLLFLLSSNLPAKAPLFDLSKTKVCETKLRSLGVKFNVNSEIIGPDECGSPRPLNIITLKNGITISSEIAVNLRCEAALALAHWVLEVLTPSAELHLGIKPTSLIFSTTYKCRRRNGNAKSNLSEHAYANGIDLLGVGFENGESMKIMARDGSSDAMRAFQAAIRGGACAYFTTVIGPMTNDAHSDHLHMDLAERKNGYRLCE